MNASKRMQLIRMLEKMENNSEYSKKLGVKDASRLISKKEHKKEC